MNNQIVILLSAILLSSCNGKDQQNEIAKNSIKKKTDSTVTIQKPENQVEHEEEINYNLPDWVLKSTVLKKEISDKNYRLDNRLKPDYLEEDFNGDGFLDVAVPISDINDNKKGFAVIHGKTFQVFILGAGKTFKNALSDNQDYIDMWRINRKKENEPGVEEETGNGENGVLLLENPSIEIDKTEVGGGQIYWNGKEYAYFHQTC